MKRPAFYKKTLQMLLVLFIASIISFLIINNAPGDPLFMYTTPGLSQVELSPEQIEEMRVSLGLDGSLLEQYVRWLGNVLRGNWGKSVINYRPVLQQIVTRIPATIGLMFSSLIVAVLIAIPLGLSAGNNQNKWQDHLISFFTYVGISIPQFWLGIILIIAFSMNLGWLPSSGISTIGDGSFIDIIKHAILPVAVLAINNIAVFVRYVRSGTIDELNEDYVLNALAKGVPKSTVLLKHVARNSLLPLITVVGMNIATMFSGAVVVENVFAWPGLGTLTLEAINNRDYPLIMGVILMSSILIFLGNLITDILYGVVDPRIREGE